MHLPRPGPRLLASLVPAIALAACASGPVEFLRRPPGPVQWPPSDEQARVRVDFVYATSADVETHPGFFRRLLDAIVGADTTELVSPCGIACDGRAVFVADTGAACVHRIDLETGEHATWRGTDRFALEMPVGIALGEAPAVYVADSARGRILEFRDGKPVRAIGEGRLQRPTGLCWDAPRGRLLVVDTTAAQVVSFDPDGAETASVGRRGAEPGAFNYPTHVAVARDGMVAVSDSMNFRVQLLSPELQPVRSIGQVGRGPGSFASPKGVAFDPDGHVWAVDGLFENVQLFDRDGTLLLTIAAGGRGYGELTLPTGICITQDGLVILADAGNSRIQALRYQSKP